jgi:arylsulfatase A
VVESALEGEPVERGFARERAFATKQPVTATLRERFEDACADPSPFLAPSRAVYRADPDEGGAVRKRYHWGETAIECRVHAPGAISRTERISPELVDEAFSDERPGVREPLEGRQVTDSATEQLAALGYY